VDHSCPIVVTALIGAERSRHPRWCLSLPAAASSGRRSHCHPSVGGAREASSHDRGGERGREPDGPASDGAPFHLVRSAGGDVEGSPWGLTRRRNLTAAARFHSRGVRLGGTRSSTRPRRSAMFHHRSRPLPMSFGRGVVRPHSPKHAGSHPMPRVLVLVKNVHQRSVKQRWRCQECSVCTREAMECGARSSNKATSNARRRGTEEPRQRASRKR
jgi:hypothetical protein